MAPQMHTGSCTRTTRRTFPRHHRCPHDNQQTIDGAGRRSPDPTALEACCPLFHVVVVANPPRRCRRHQKLGEGAGGKLRL